jgi:4-amino-4-deoxy-L-arabinose transferase-like glycosyltransferase
MALLIGITLLVRLLFAASLGLGVDESYMVAAGRDLRFGYFDHPPISWWLAWSAAQLAGTDAAFAVRLPFVLLFALSTWLVFRLTSDLFDARAGLGAAALFNVIPVLGITTGSWVLPDGPLVAALLGAAVCLARALPAGGCRGERPEKRSAWGWWLGAGACFGVALGSKYTAVLSGAGTVMYLLTEPRARRWLGRPQPYAAALLALGLFAPVVGWNAAHGWASLLFQGGRAEGGRWYPFGPLVTLGGEALFLLPWVWLPLTICLWRAARRGTGDPRGWLLACLALPPILLFELVSLRSHVLFHWAVPGYVMALPLLGEVIARRYRASRPLRVALATTAATVALGALLVATEVHFNWLPEVVEDFAFGADPDLGAVDWTSLRTELLRRGELRPGTVVAATRWHDAGKIDYALGGAVPVICLGADPRQYGLSAPAALYAGKDLLIVAPRESLASFSARFDSSFDTIEELPPVLLYHAGRPAMRLPLFLGHQLRALASAE